MSRRRSPCWASTSLAVVVLAVSSCLGWVESFTLPQVDVGGFNVGDIAEVANEAQGLVQNLQVSDLEQLPVAAKGAAAAALLLPVAPTVVQFAKSIVKSVIPSLSASNNQDGNAVGSVSYPEGQPATYEMLSDVVPFEFGEAAFVRPLLKQTQLETRKLQVVYDANRDGYDARVFHSKVDGKGASVVLAKVGGKWCGGYNPRGWASLGQARSSVAAFLFYQKGFGGGWQKVRASRTGSMACGNDLFDGGIYFGADSLVIPLTKPNVRSISSRLGQYFEARPEGGRAQYTILPRPSIELNCQELKVLSGVYAPGEGMYTTVCASSSCLVVSHQALAHVSTFFSIWLSRYPQLRRRAGAWILLAIWIK